MNPYKHKMAMDWITRKKEPKPMPIVDYIKKLNSLYSTNGNEDDADVPYETNPKYMPIEEKKDILQSIPVSPLVKKKKKPSWKYESWSDGIEKLEKEKKVADIKDSALYKLLENPKVLGVELGHETILEIINLIQYSGLAKKPKKEPVKVAVVAKPKDAIDHIGFLESLRKI